MSIQAAGKTFSTLDDQIELNGEKVIWAALGDGHVVYPDIKSARKYLLKISGEINLSWVHTCYSKETGDDVQQIANGMVGRISAVIECDRPIYVIPNLTISGNTGTVNNYLPGAHYFGSMPDISAIGISTFQRGNNVAARWAVKARNSMPMHTLFRHSGSVQKWGRYLDDATSYVSSHMSSVTSGGVDYANANWGNDFAPVEISPFNAQLDMTVERARAYISDRSWWAQCGVNVEMTGIPYLETQHAAGGLSYDDVPTVSGFQAYARVPFTHVDYANYDTTTGEGLETPDETMRAPDIEWVNAI